MNKSFLSKFESKLWLFVCYSCRIMAPYPSCIAWRSEKLWWWYYNWRDNWNFTVATKVSHLVGLGKYREASRKKLHKLIFGVEEDEYYKETKEEKDYKKRLINLP